jgi:thiol-disulfide isomerase/thioredoxin
MYPVSKITLPILAFGSALLVSCSSTAPQASQQTAKWEPDEGAELIGTKVPEFADLTWVNSKPLTIASLKGKPIFLRFWKADCPNCEQSIPTVNYLYKTYTPKGLIVIGINFGGFYSPEQAKVRMDQWSVRFPVALDHHKNTLERFWAKDIGKGYSSISMLIDKKGIIRWLHPGGILGLPPSMGGYEDSPAFDSLKQAIDQVLAEKN